MMNARPRSAGLMAGLATACAAISVTSQAAAPASTTEASPRAPMLQTSTTEEGQTVVYDAYTWQRRELDKKLSLWESWPTEGDLAAQFKRFGLDKPPVPSTIPAPSKIMRDVYLVNSVPNLTYLIDAGPQGLILVDPGLEANVESILKNIEALGFKRDAVKWVINTHAHFDHAMADAHFQKLGAKILVGRADAAAVEKGTEVTAKYALPPAIATTYPTLKVDWPVDDGEDLRLGDKLLVAIATPGHTPGSTCYLMVIDRRAVLFGGDTILFDYRLGAQGTPYSDNVAYLASLKKLDHFFASPIGNVHWDVLLPGHGTIVLDRAYLDVEKGVRQMQWDVANSESVKALPFADEGYRKLMLGRP